MNNPDSQLKELLEKYLDNQLTEDQRTLFEAQANQRKSLSDSIDLQSRIDDSLKRISAPPAKPKLVLPSLASLQAEGDGSELQGNALPQRFNLASDAANGRSVSTSRRRIWMTSLLSSAAALIWLLVGLQIFSSGNSGSEIAFRPIPLTEVYLQSIDEGFQPYWVCDDPVTFANTFQNRQGVPLRLEQLPANSKMLGLAYLGGLSRSSTSLLATVDGKPVLVFIDRIENDWGPPTGYDSNDEIRVTREEKFGLVFYEVSPTTVTAIMDYVSQVSLP